MEIPCVLKRKMSYKLEVSIGYWIGFFVFVMIMLALDLGVFHKTDEEPSVKSSLLWSAFWIGLAFVFAGGVWYFGGKAPAVDFITAYLLEKSLSIDNLFIFILVFSYFKIAPKYQHRILFWGVFGALVMRVIFIFGGAALLHRFEWLMYIFGAFLVYTGIKMFFEKDGDQDLNDSGMIKLLRKFLPIKEDVVEPHFLVKDNGKGICNAVPVGLVVY